MNKIMLFLGAGSLGLLGFIFHFESYLSGAFVLMWIGLAVNKEQG